MTQNKKIRIELRFDEVEDKDIIDFIDKNGSTRAGFIKQVLMMYKNQTETMTPTTFSNAIPETKVQNSSVSEKKPKTITDISFSSNDLD